MYIQKIRINKFKSIYDQLELNFEDIKGFWQIGGSVGAGKTTIGEAIIYGLFGSVTGKNNADLISWGHKHAEIEVWCQSKGHDIYIKRQINSYGQSPVYVEIDNEPLVFTNKRDGQLQLENDYYDVTRTTLELLCIISFNNFKSLATLNSNDTKKFLDQILGFHILSQYADICRDLRKGVLAEWSDINNQINNNQSQINKILEISSIERINGSIQDTKNIINELDAKYKQTDSDFSNVIKSKHKEWMDLQAQLKTIKTLGANKKKEIDFIKKGTCPTCGSSIDQSQLNIKEQEREVLLEQYNTTFKNSNDKQIEISEIEKQKKEIIDNLNEKIKQQQNILTQLNEQEKRSKINMNAIDELNQQNKLLQQKSDNINAETAEWDELFDILNEGVRAKILSSFIPTLNKNILKYTQQLHQPYIVEFDSTFKCSIRICGMSQQVPLSSLSTGQLKTVDMCIIMGVLGTIMSNISFNIMFLDELFSNLDSDLRSVMCGALKQNQNPSQTVFIISHVGLDKKYFDGEILAELQYIDEVHKKSIYTIEKSEII